MLNALKNDRGWSLLRVLFWIFFLTFMGGLVGGGLVYFNLTRDLPRIESLKDYRPPIVTEVYDDREEVIGEFFVERRKVVVIDEIPPMLVNAFVASEDARFWEHEGLDFIGILRALYANIKAGEIRQGGSTITQQVTKSLLLTPTRSFRRKFREAVLAYRIERYLSKEELITLYLNQIYLGHGSYGVASAAENYFNIPLGDLNLSQCALLAGLPKAPSRYSPISNPDAARARQEYVLGQMVRQGYITEDEAKEAGQASWELNPRKPGPSMKLPYFTEHVRRMLEARYGRKNLYEEGLKVFTTVNTKMQLEAESAVRKGLKEYEVRRGFNRFPIRNREGDNREEFLKELAKERARLPLKEGLVTLGLVDEVRRESREAVVELVGGKGFIQVEPPGEGGEDILEKLGPGDEVFVQLKELDPGRGMWRLVRPARSGIQAALVCMKVDTGFVKALVGGWDFVESQFNRAIQSHRQPGSAFKPIIYTAALDKGYTPSSVIIDAPVIFDTPERGEGKDAKWKPRNYKGSFFGPTTLRMALIHSRNVVTVKLLEALGVGYVVDYARRMGIASPLSHDLSLALGSSGLPLLELTSAYSVFPNLGELITPIFVTKVLDRTGKVLLERKPRRERVISRETAYIMTHLLTEVVQYGTGRRVRGVAKAVGGKTGTTNDQEDAWFLGFTPTLLAGVWVGYDEKRPLGDKETGSRAASPIWRSFMEKVLKERPERDAFEVPEGVVFARVDPATGLLASPDLEDAVKEVYRAGTAPTEYASPDKKRGERPRGLPAEDVFQ